MGAFIIYDNLIKHDEVLMIYDRLIEQNPSDNYYY